jgi:hypothetical protein
MPIHIVIEMFMMTIVAVDVDNKLENEDKATLDMDDVMERIFATNTFVVKSKSGNPLVIFVMLHTVLHFTCFNHICRCFHKAIRMYSDKIH